MSLSLDYLHSTDASAYKGLSLTEVNRRANKLKYINTVVAGATKNQKAAYQQAMVSFNKRSKDIDGLPNVNDFPQAIKPNSQGLSIFQTALEGIKNNEPVNYLLLLDYMAEASFWARGLDWKATEDRIIFLYTVAVEGGEALTKTDDFVKVLDGFRKIANILDDCVKVSTGILVEELESQVSSGKLKGK